MIRRIKGWRVYMPDGNAIWVLDADGHKWSEETPGLVAFYNEHPRSSVNGRPRWIIREQFYRPTRIETIYEED